MRSGQLLSLVAAPAAAASVLGWIGGRASTAQERRRLYDLAHRDALTGVLNRAGFAKVARTVRADGGGRPAAMLVDLDGFKRINDTHGHAAGDAVLVEVADVLQRCVRPWKGVVGRLGGDEFAVLLSIPGGPEEVLGVAATVVQGLTRTCMVPAAARWVGIPVSATVGVGIGGPAAAEVDQDRLLQAADEAMYAARRSCTSWSVRSAGADLALAGRGTTGWSERCPEAGGHRVGPTRWGVRSGPRSAPHGSPCWPAGHQAAGVPLAWS